MKATLEYWNGEIWVSAYPRPFHNERLAWLSLGGDDLNYRTLDEDGNVLTTKPARLADEIPSRD